METTVSAQSAPTTPATPKVDLTKMPTYDITRNNVTKKLVPYQYGKKGDRQGEVFYAPEQVTPENEQETKSFFGTEWWYKKINTAIRQAFQQLDSVFTNKGTEPLDIQDILESATKLSTRGEPIGVMKATKDLILQWFTAFTENPAINEDVINKTFASVNALACSKHEATKEDDDDSDPTLLEDSLKDSLINAVHGAIQAAKANPKYANLQMDIVRELAQGQINAAVFGTLSAELKRVNEDIVKNTKTRKPRKTREEAAADAEPANA